MTDKRQPAAHERNIVSPLGKVEAKVFRDVFLK